MKLHFSILTLILVASLSGVVVADDNATAVANNSTSTTTVPTTQIETQPKPNETASTSTASRSNNSTSASGPSLGDGVVNLNRDRTTYVTQVGPVTKVVDYDYEDGQFHILIESKIPNMLTLTEVIKIKEGASAFGAKRTRVPKGRSVVTVSAAPINGAAAVTITNSQCLAAESCTMLSTGDRASDGSSPFEATSSTAGWLGGASVAVMCAGLSAYQRKHKDHGDVQEAN